MNHRDAETQSFTNVFTVLPRHRVIASLIFVHLLITLPLAYILNAWVDEASTLYNTQHGFFDTFQNVFQTEKQAPLYFLLLSLWRNIDASIFFARLFSIFCSCLAIKFFYDLARSFFNEKQTILITTFFALHPYLIWASLEIRLYSMVILLSVLWLKFFNDGYLNPRVPVPIHPRVAFVITAIIAIYTNYYLGFLLVGGFVTLLVLRQWKMAQTYFLQMFAVALAILPLVWAIKMQLAENTSGHQQVSSFIDGIKILWGHSLNFIFPTELLAPEEQTKISYLRIWLVRFGILVAILLIIKNKFRALDDRRVLLFSIFSSVIFAFLLFAFSILGGEYISIRHAAILFVPLILLISSLFANLLSSKSWIVLAIIFALLFPYSIYSLYPTFAKRGDWWNIAKFIKENEKPNQPIVTSQAYDAISLPIHYNGVNKVLPNEKFFEWDLEDSLKSENAFKKQTEFIISKIPPDAEEIWLLTRDTCHLPETKASCRPLENFVETNYTIEIEKDFYLEKLRLLKKK